MNTKLSEVKVGNGKQPVSNGQILQRTHPAFKLLVEFVKNPQTTLHFYNQESHDQATKKEEK